MNTHTRGFVVFVAMGCVAAGATGWGVWRATAPDDAFAANETTTSRTASPVTIVTTAVPTPQPTETTPGSADASERHKMPQQQAKVSQSDPYLAPNAYIPDSQTPVTPPTRVYAPNSLQPTPTGDHAATSPSTTATDPTPSQPTDNPNNPTEPPVTTSPTEPSNPPTEPTDTSVPTEPTPEQPTEVTPEPTPTDAPTGTAPAPSEETPTTSVEEPSPIDPAEPGSTPEPSATPTTPTPTPTAGAARLSPFEALNF
ncbi:hypothetical protein WG915_07130 [Corynebacterium sp. H128]|uniref:hypothetical protein n=1 Tax=Corynebacterium sp. H128 TaxID=3133427 RepID=UPI0030B02B18